MKFLKKYFPVIFLALFCLIIIGIWFKDGKLLATGEEGLMLINPVRAIDLHKYSWNDIRSGTASPVSNLRVPFFYLESHITNLGLPLWIFQATIFFFLMSTGALSIYFLCKELLEDKIGDDLVIKVALVAGIFYILNPISMIGVWYRFLLGFMFFYALAPLFFYLYVVGVNNKRKIFIILAPLITLFFTFAYGNPAMILLLWFLPFIYSLSLSLQHSLNKSFRIFPILYFIFTFLFWVLINLWWVFPYVSLSKLSFASETTVHNIGTLKANSTDFILPNVVRLIHGGFLYRNEAFGSIYKLPFFLILSWLIPIITIYGLIRLKSGQIKLFFTVTLILLLFLVKGTSPPLGEIFLWFFSKITFLQVYRNPLEKIGMLLPIIYAPLFSFGLFYLLYKIQNYKKRILLLVLALAGLGVFHWPFFSGALVSFGGRDIRVVVPPSFQSANQVIPSGNHVILSIPVMGGASGFYKWQYGYKGVESSEYLFHYPVINIFYDATSFSGQMLIGFSNGYLNNLIGMAQIFSADIVAYRKDTNVLTFGYNLDALERSEKMIKTSNLSKIFDSQQVSLWTLPKEKIVPVIYTPHSVRFGDSPQELISLLENHQFDPKAEVYICTNKDNCKPNIESSDLSRIRIDAAPEKIEFIKISPVSYEIKVYNSQGRFLLVFNNSYHPGWVASIEGKPINDNRHIVANGYANGFIIDDVGNFAISLRFLQEEDTQRFNKVSLLAISLGMIILFGSIIKIFITSNRHI